MPWAQKLVSIIYCHRVGENRTQTVCRHQRATSLCFCKCLSLQKYDGWEQVMAQVVKDLDFDGL